jgi:translation initiation factor 2 beta subunit (eIF-2beta)/eIF-5
MSNVLIPSINIGGVDDEHYRYSMPTIAVKHAKNKTLLLNILEIAKALHATRPSPSPGEIVKFFAFELATRGKCPDNDKLRKNKEGASLSGYHPCETLQKKLDCYIENFVLCGVCRKPETKYRHKKGSIWLECFGCGAVEEIQGQHKLCKHIIKESVKWEKTKKRPTKQRDDSPKEIFRRQKAGLATGQQLKIALAGTRLRGEEKSEVPGLGRGMASVAFPPQPTMDDKTATGKLVPLR